MNYRDTLNRVKPGDKSNNEQFLYHVTDSKLVPILYKFGFSKNFFSINGNFLIKNQERRKEFFIKIFFFQG